MNNPKTVGLVATITAIVVLFASHGTAFFGSMEIAFNFLLAISAKAPLGVGSFFLSLFMAMLVWLALQKWTKEARNRWSRSTFIDIAAVAVGAYVSYMQLPTSNGILFGIMAGLAAPHPARWSMALATYIGHKLQDSGVMVKPPAAPSPEKAE